MLFDLRGRGRRRTIQTIYLFLAVLMGGGLVFFGVGGTGIGLFNSDNNGGGGGSANPVTAQLKAAEKRVKTQPTNPVAWADLAKQRFFDASSGKNYDSQTHTYKDSGLGALRKAAQAWDRYLALNPKSIDVTVANLMRTAFGATGLKDYKAAVKADEALTASDPKNLVYFKQLAIDAALAKQTHKSEQAEALAISLAPKATRKDFKSSLENDKAAALAQQQQDSPQPAQPLPGG